MIELLSPAGSPEAVRAAVQNGADAVYLGYGNFNARRNAANFDQRELRTAVEYCHVRGVKVYLTLNTLLSDTELDQAALLVDQANQLGVDALLVQDLGVVRMARQVAPDLPLHASTQMTIHSLDGAKAAADLGLERVVVSRELSRDQIAYLCAHAPVEIECFVHGALCMCYSGQCYLSSVIGGRSGNRGMCAQPCRLNYGWGQVADTPLLSLKDLSLSQHLQELERIGVACAKIEGRMKRPEYVAIVTQIYATALREGRNPTPAEQKALQQAFSRQGFTDAYFLHKTGRKMFGIREKLPVPEKLFAAARTDYSREHSRIPVTLYAQITAGKPVQIGVRDNQDLEATAAGPVPETARKFSLAREQVELQLSKTGGTPYHCVKVLAQVDENLSLPLSVLNSLRRQVLKDLSSQRSQPPQRCRGTYHPGVRYENRTEPPVFTISALRVDQISPRLLALKPGVVTLPSDEIIAHPDKVDAIVTSGVETAVTLPRVFWDRGELHELERHLEQIYALGVHTAYAGTLAGIHLAQRMGFQCRGDFGLGVYNAQTIKELKRMNLKSVTLSFEQRIARIRDLSKAMDCEIMAYGRLPLMITENCIIRNRYGQCGCQSVNQLIDRTGAHFPVLRTFGCRNELYNSKKLFLADKPNSYLKSGLWGVRLFFTTENARECLQVLKRYRQEVNFTPNELTRGLYYRDVE